MKMKMVELEKNKIKKKEEKKSLYKFIQMLPVKKLMPN